LGRNKITNAPTPSTGKDWKNIIPGLAVSAICLVVVFYFIDPNQLLQALKLADYRLVFVGFLVSVSWLLVRGMVWRTLLQNKASYSQVFFTVTEGYLLNNLLPFRLGEVARALLLSQKAGLQFWGVLSTIVIERILDLAMAVGLLLITLPFVVGASWAAEAAFGAGSLVVVGLAVLYLLARYREWAIRQYEKFGAQWPILLRIGGGRITEFLNGLSVLTAGTLFLKAIAWSIANWLVAIAQYYLLMLAFFPHANLLWAAFALGVAALGIAAPSSPGALGVMELSIVGALALFGLNSSTALAYAIVMHVFNYLSNGLLGSYALARDGESLTGLYQGVRRMPQKGAPEEKISIDS
jgi:uncharacterized protein (TIRG00374 family)